LRKLKKFTISIDRLLVKKLSINKIVPEKDCFLFLVKSSGFVLKFFIISNIEASADYSFNEDFKLHVNYQKLNSLPNLNYNLYQT
jgi:hypothetical protein